jgi:hypothetical protein
MRKRMKEQRTMGRRGNNVYVGESSNFVLHAEVDIHHITQLMGGVMWKSCDEDSVMDRRSRVWIRE